jgi:polysaccharide export outer membrane protein
VAPLRRRIHALPTLLLGRANAPPALLIVCAIALSAALVGCASPPERAIPESARVGKANGAPVEALADLWRERRSAPVSALPLGAGDRLRISVPGLPEFSSLETVVGADGDLSLPLVGALPAAGRSDAALARDLESALEHYMYDPQVSLVVLQSASRMVGVIGAVAKPGYYAMRDGSDTVLDLIAAAGGLSAKASSTLHLVPAEARGSEPDPLGAARSSELLPIDLAATSADTAALYATLPMRPGDILIAAERGHVLVTGWVEAPGSYPISPGMTVLAAVSAAGGTQFPADRDVRIARNGESGNKERFQVDLDAIESGVAADLSVRDGDVIHVDATAPKAAGWGIYRFVTAILSIGL